jgi:HEAT repeat protein
MRRILPLAILLLIAAPRASAYIDGGGARITLPEIILEFRSVAVVEVDKVDIGKGLIRYQVVEPLKGKRGSKAIKHQLSLGKDAPAPLKQLKPGHKAVFFTDCVDKRSLTFLDGVWYYTRVKDDGWEEGEVRPEFLQVFTGTTAGLIDTIKHLLRGQDVTVRCQRRGNPKESAFVRYSFREPHIKFLVRDPAAAPAKDRPVDDWVKRLKEAAPATRLEAALALAELGGAARPAVGALARAVEDENEEVRYAATYALGEIGAGAKDAVPALARALADDDWFVRLTAAQSLEKIGPDAKAALPALGKALKPTDPVKDYRPIRSAAVARALVRIDPKGKDVPRAVALVIESVLNDERQDADGSRVAGARALAAMGPPAAAAVPDLLRRLKDGDGTVRIAAAVALVKIAPDKHTDTAVQTLIVQLKNDDVLARVLAAQALGELGPSGKPGQGALEQAARDPEPQVREAAAAAHKAIAGKP